MAIEVRGDSFIDYLHAQANKLDSNPARKPQGVAILSGQLLKRNLKERLDREGISATPLARFITIEDLATQLLAPTDEPQYILSEGVRDRLIESILASFDPDPASELPQISAEESLRPAEKDALETLAKRLPYTKEDTRETFRTELDDYLRWTDAAKDVTPAIRRLAKLDNPFAQQQSNRAMSAFRGFERVIEARLESASISRQQSRSHLVRAARQAVPSQWPAQFKHIEWIAVSGISVFDNPTLRFLESIAAEETAPDVLIFTEQGSQSYNSSRINAVEMDSTAPTSTGGVPDFRSEAAETLMQATSSSPERVPENVTFTEAPTDQRAVEKLAADVRELVEEGVHPRDILIIAPDAGSYQSLVEQAFETVELPVHVETRRPYANIPAYRYVRDFIDVIDAYASDESLSYDELVDPLRLGYCPPGAQGEQWPISGREFTKVEQEMHRKQQYYNRDPDRYEDQGIKFEKWRELIEEIPHWTGPWHTVNRYLDDVERFVDSPPASGAEIVETFSSYMGTYVYQTVDHERALYTGPAIDTTRTQLSEIHPTSEAERVRGSLEQVGSHYDRVQALFNAPASWTEVGRAFSSAIGGQSYGKPHADQYAVPVVDAGNAYYREADYVYILGMNAEEFPSEASTPTFLHKELRQEAYQAAVTGDTPYHHLDSRATSYGEALDFYQASLSTANPSAEITLYHTYRDERGNEIAWSSFVDLFNIDSENESSEAVERVSIGSWIPQPRSEQETWEDVTARVAPRERLRMFLYQAHRSTPADSPATTPEGLEAILARLDQQPISDLILPRVERHHTPPTAVEIQPDEPAFDETPLTAVSGEPHHPHELDLQAQCGLKYYFYQFLYNFTGSDPEREEIPRYYASQPHYRLGKLPYIVRENYADPRYVNKWKQLITELLPDRQSTTDGLAQFNSDEELRLWVRDQDVFEEYDENTIYQNLRGERRLVAAEREADIVRDWEWRNGGSVEIEGQTLAVPQYRVDIVTNGDSEYALPIFFTRFSNRGESALKSCYDGAIWEVTERTGKLCLECGREDNCNFHSKYVIDHRMLAGHRSETDKYSSKVVGIGMQEQYAGPTDGDRILAIQNNYTNKVQPSDVGYERLVPRGFPQNWEESVEAWEENFTDLSEELKSDSSVTLGANQTLVTQDECLDCVYRDLCAVPDSEVTFQ